MNNVIVEIVKNMYNEYGTELFCNSEKLNTYMHDLLAEFPNERRRMSVAVPEGLVKKMIETSARNEKFNQYVYVDVLHNSYGMDKVLAEEVVKIFGSVIFGSADVFNETEVEPILTESNDKRFHEELTKQQIALADMLFEKGLKEDAYKQYLNIVENNKSPAAMWRVAKCLLHGWGIDVDENKAKQFFAEASKYNYIDAVYFMATNVYADDEKKAFAILKKLADEHVHPGACYTLGHLYAKGIGCQQDYNAAFEMTRIAAEKNHYFAMTVLSSMYLTGVGVKQSDEKAREWQKKSETVPRTTERIFIEKIKKESNL